jgi:hypothetical protein
MQKIILAIIVILGLLELARAKIGIQSQAKNCVQQVLSFGIAELLKQRTLLGSVVHIDHGLFYL